MEKEPQILVHKHPYIHLTKELGAPKMSSKNEFFKKLVQLNPSSVFVAAFGICLFYSGFFFPELSGFIDKVKDERERIIIITTMVGLPLSFFKFIDLTISKEKGIYSEENLQKNKKEQPKEIAAYLNKYKSDIKQELEKIKDSISSESLSDEIFENLSKKIARIEKETGEVIATYEEAYKIAAWLDEKVLGQAFGHRYKLLNDALESLEIDDDQIIEMFDEDIWQCIQWIRDTLISPVPCIVDPQTMLSAFLSGKLGCETYITALTEIKNSIKNERSLGTSRHKDIATDIAINHLISKIQSPMLSKQLSPLNY
ncbi:MAG: hypothetical protein WBA57_16135 [Elainellaceae cyanobacterium]